jgi:hypothetical protein
MDSFKFHSGPPCPTLLPPTGRPLMKQPYGLFRGGPPAGWAGCGRLLPFWTPHAVRLRRATIFDFFRRFSLFRFSYRKRFFCFLLLSVVITTKEILRMPQKKYEVTSAEEFVSMSRQCKAEAGMGIWFGVSKGVEDGRRQATLGAGHP